MACMALTLSNTKSNIRCSKSILFRKLKYFYVLFRKYFGLLLSKMCAQYIQYCASAGERWSLPFSLELKNLHFLKNLGNRYSNQRTNIMQSPPNPSKNYLVWHSTSRIVELSTTLSFVLMKYSTKARSVVNPKV